MQRFAFDVLPATAMALSVFFVANEAELDALFPGWLPPNETVRWLLRPASSPTSRPCPYPRFDPSAPPRPLGHPSFLDDAWPPALAPVSADDGHDAEDACPPGLRAVPHFCVRELDDFGDFREMAEAVLGETVAGPPARIGPVTECVGYPMQDGSYPQADALSAALIRRLAAAEGPDLRRLAQRMVPPHGRSRDEIDEAISEWVRELFFPLRILCGIAFERGARVCHWWTLA